MQHLPLGGGAGDLKRAAREGFARGLGRLRPVFVVLVLGAILAIVPGTTCLLRLSLDIPCPACGLTRAGLALLRLDLPTAHRLQPLALVLALLVLGTSIAAFVADPRLWKRIVKWSTGAAAVGLVLVWALRFVGLFGGPVP